MCIGLHLATMEIGLVTAKFFRDCADIKVLTVDKDMEFENFFLIAPKGHKCVLAFK